MIPIPPGWRVEPNLGSFTLTHPAGSEAGRIIYRERMGPLRPLRVLLRDFLEVTPTFTDVSVGTPERLVTLEGEHAALVTLRGRERDAPAVRALGFVLTEDFFSCTSGLTVRPEEGLVDTVRRLVVADSLALGVRRRRFDYAPPEGWEPVVHGLISEWYPPEFPNETAYISVYPATPWIAGVRTLADIGAGKTSQREPPERVAATSGLAGEAHRYVVADLHRELVLLDDVRYSYALQLSARSAPLFARHRFAFRALVASIEPVPLPSPELTPAHMARLWFA
jgi:hypothetical protein